MATIDFEDSEGLTENPPRIISFSDQEREIKTLIEVLKPKLDDEGRSLLRMLLKKWGPFYLNSMR